MGLLPQRLYQRRTAKTGMTPGTPMLIGRQKVDTMQISAVDFDGDGVHEVAEVVDIDGLKAARDSAPVTWINVTGLHQVEKMEAIGAAFEIHPLLVEDLLNTEQRPKVEQYDDYLFVILKFIHWNVETEEISTEQISLVLGNRFVLTFQEREDDVFTPVMERIRHGKGRIRHLGADYLAYALLDVVVDHYFVILEQLGDRLEALEDDVLATPTPAALTQIQATKRAIFTLRRYIWPLREIIGSLQRGEAPLFHKTTLIYLRDIYEHTVQIIDTIDTYQDIAASLLDIYLSSASNRMNEVMKVLTIIATIFIPLSFIASVYGMNFQYMPEIHLRWAYPSLWVLFVVISAVMLAYFRRRRWL